MNEQELLAELEKLTARMSVPAARRVDVGWLNRNVAINNSGPELDDVREILARLRKLRAA